MNSEEVGLLARAEDLAPLFAEQASIGESLGRLSEPTVRALRDNGFLSLMVPRCLGGVEATTIGALRVIEALSAADGSTGWVAMASGLCVAAAGAFLEENAAREIFKDGHAPLIAGHGAPNGKAIIEGGGFRLSGDWRYGSGVLNADYVHSGAIIYEGEKPRLTESGQPEIRIFVTKPSDANFDGNWNVLGLKATGSVDYKMRDVYVPASYTHRQNVMAPLRGGSFYTIGLLGFALIAHTGFAMGVGRRVLDEIAKYARTHAGSAGPLRTSERFHDGYALAEAHCRGAGALVYETWRDIEATISRGEPMTTRQVTLARLALRHATDAAANAAIFGYREAGGTSLREGPLQRCFRDIHAGTQHLHTSSLVFTECGRELAGMAEGETWGRFGLSKGDAAIR